MAYSNELAMKKMVIGRFTEQALVMNTANLKSLIIILST